MALSCLNCNQPINKSTNYCNNCGQKIAIKDLNFWSIVSDFFTNLFNLDAKIWRTLRDIWIPARLTIAYISGKRVMYYNPLRIFIICLFTFFALFLFQIKDSFDEINEAMKEQEYELWQEDLVIKYDSLSRRHQLSTEMSQEFRSVLFIHNDSINNSIADSTDVIGLALDSIQKDTALKKINDNFEFTFDDDGTNINLGGSTKIFGVRILDLFSLSEEELRKKHEFDSKFETLFIVQLQRITKNLGSSIKFFIGNGTWVQIVLILLIAWFFKLLYWRHTYLYAEHFIFHVYGHTRLLILAIVGVILDLLIFDNGYWIPILFIVGTTYSFADMKVFYKQSNLKTFIKFSASFIVYNVLSIVCLVAVFGLSMLIF